MATATILDPAGLLSKKYAAALGFGAGHAAAEASSGSERAGRARADMKCIVSFGIRLACVPVSFAFCAWLCLGEGKAGNGSDGTGGGKHSRGSEGVMEGE